MPRTRPYSATTRSIMAVAIVLLAPCGTRLARPASSSAATEFTGELAGGASGIGPRVSLGKEAGRRVRAKTIVPIKGGPRVRIPLPPAGRWYGAGGEEMAPSSLYLTDGVP